MSRKAMQMALEALEDSNDVARMEFGDEDYYSEAINALRQALETEKDPVAFINVEKQKLEWAKLTSWHTPTIVNLPKIPLYTAPPKRDLTCVCGAVWEGETMVHPPTKHEWVGLTDEERHSIREWRGIQKELGPVWAPMLLYLYEAIEAKLKEKNT